MKTEDKVIYAYSFDQERYNEGSACIDETLKIAKAESDGEVGCWIGKIFQKTYEAFMPDADHIIEYMQVNAACDGPEIAETYIDDWSGQFRKDRMEQMDKDIIEALAGVFKKHGLDINPHFWTVYDVKEFIFDETHPLKPVSKREGL